MKNNPNYEGLTLETFKEAFEEFFKIREQEDDEMPTVVEVYPGIFRIGTKKTNFLTNYRGLEQYNKALKEAAQKHTII